jgi:hypothetical protein
MADSQKSATHKHGIEAYGANMWMVLQLMTAAQNPQWWKFDNTVIEQNLHYKSVLLIYSFLRRWFPSS